MEPRGPATSRSLLADAAKSYMRVPTDSKLLDTACDVVIRFRGHRSYGNEAGAIKALRRRAPGHALRRRAPGHTLEEYQAAFEFLCEVYDRAVAAVPRHRLNRPEKTTDVAEFEDIDYVACMKELNKLKPGIAKDEKRWILNWCIFWCYLK